MGSSKFQSRSNFRYYMITLVIYVNVVNFGHITAHEDYHLLNFMKYFLFMGDAGLFLR